MLKPKSPYGEITVTLTICFFVFLITFGFILLSGEKGGEKYYSNLKLTIPFTLSWITGILALFTGVYSIVKQKERSPLVFLSVIIGILISFWITMEIAFPH